MGSTCAALTALLAAQLSFCQHFEVQAHTLANGMKILVQEDHAIPNVAMHLFFRAGSRTERPGSAGISHFLEHMMFNGAWKYGPGQFDLEMEHAGGSNNAFTTHDLTVYTNSFPPSALELIFDLESDRLKNLALDPAMLESERGVVLSERRSTVETSGSGMLWEELYAAAFRLHPYGWPVIGRPSDISSFQRQDLYSYFRRGYAPNHCVTVIVGDVQAGDVLRLARRYLESIPPQDTSLQAQANEPAQMEERRVSIRRGTASPLLLMGYRAAAAGDADFQTLRLLSYILTEGRTSRLGRRLVEKDRLASSVDSIAPATLDPGLFVISIHPFKDGAAAQRAADQEIARLCQSKVSEAEMGKARNQLLTDVWREAGSISGRANLLGNYEVYYGGYSKLFSLEAELERITPEAVLRVARRYLGPENRTVATLSGPDGGGI